MADDVMLSTSDMVSMAPQDLFSGSDAPVADESSTQVDAASTQVDEQIDTEIGTPEAVEDQPGEPEEETEESPAETEEQPQEQTQEEEELPEGVKKGKDRNGKDGLFVEPSRWKTIYGNHQLVQQAAEVLGQPLTPDVLRDIADTSLASDNLHDMVTGGDPARQGEIIGDFFDEMIRQRNDGEIGVDATVPFAQQFYEQVQQKSPAAYEALMIRATGDLLKDMFNQGATGGNEALFTSAQNIVKALTGGTDAASVRDIARRMGLPFYAKSEMQGLSQQARNQQQTDLATENQKLREQLSGRNATSAAAQFQTWYGETSTAVNSGILDEAIKPALSSVEKNWSAFPDEYQKSVVQPLHSEVMKTIGKDSAFGDKIRLLHGQAQRAVSAQARNQVAQQIKQAYTSRARLAVEAVKGPILKEAAQRLQWQASQKNARLTNGQSRSAVKGATGTVPRGILPNNLPQMGDNYDPKVAAAQMRAILS